MQTPREICLKLLVSTERGQEYSNLALDSALRRYPDLRDIDRRFVSALYYSVLERKLALDAVINSLCSRPADRLSPELRQILRMGVCQILYMDSVPESAAVNESVKLASKLRNKGAAGFVNALLRSFIRDGCKLPKSGVKLKDLSVEYSCPEWIVRSFINDYGEDTAFEILKSSLGRAPMTARLNTCKFRYEDIVAELSAENVSVKDIPFAGSCAELIGCGSVESLSAYKKGMLHIQDLSCQICCRELDPKPGETVLDLCAAPGGKTFTVAELMGDSGRVYAYDLHPNRVGLIASGAARLGLGSVTAGVNNAKIFSESVPKADRILCDVPCSGLGVIRRKPDIKYRPESELSALANTQYEILSTSSRYLKAGGTLIYSTCTLRRCENEDIVEKFLSENPDFAPVKLNGFTDYHTTILPQTFGSDGFFIAKLQRKR